MVVVSAPAGALSHRKPLLPGYFDSVTIDAVPEPRILQLAYELEWLGCELEYYGQKHAHQGFPKAGEAWETFLEKQRGVLSTAEKIERELKSAIRFNPKSLVGIDYPLEQVRGAESSRQGPRLHAYGQRLH